MRRIFGIALGILGIIFLASCHSEDDITELSKQQVYFFYQQTCPHCHTAAKYIKNKYPDLKIISRDLKLPGNRKLFKDAVTQYKIRGSAGTPLICFGEHYIMGWGPKDKELFDYYIQPYLQN